MSMYVTILTGLKGTMTPTKSTPWAVLGKCLKSKDFYKLCEYVQENNDINLKRFDWADHK